MACAGLLTAADAQAGWRAPRAHPLDDAQAARRVHPAAETRPGNAAANHYRPSPAELEAFRHGQRDRYGRTAVDFNPLTRHVTGGFTGTTDEILQWAGRKWGIPARVVRAVAVTESSWRMSQLGDRTRVRDAGAYPSWTRIPGTADVFQSVGVMQVRWTRQGLHLGTEPLRWRSTAFNVDYWAAVVRYYYDGRCDWCGPGYRRGRRWASIGAWSSPSPWASARAYVRDVKAQRTGRPWARPGF